ncbi:DUF2971 domain-containing protein [Pseudohongiella sp. O18]|uniref:DUF2971 domain-containing protein n=1 Tax=Pseudohongiella sp. O18 TaxID=2904248 RepID=UPI001F1C4FAC|nr:DUF2971 domain-containing protein [Pseudohongiella sp. O18]
MRVYYYTAEKYALSNIINERIKISMLDELNDPFEFLGVNLSDKKFRKAFEAGRDAAAKDFGIISFSRGWKNPLLWAHYGDKHRGICLGFDIDDAHIKEVKYFPKRMIAEIDMEKEFGGITEELIESLLCAKYVGWKYEDEVRVIVPLKQKDTTGLFLTDFDGNMELKEIILGPRSELKISDFATHLRSYKHEVKVTKSRIAFTKYDVVQNMAIKVYVHRT